MPVAEDKAPEVGARLEETAGEPSRDLEEELVPLGVLEGVAAHGGLRESFLPALQRVVDPVAVPESRRHVTGELVDFAGGVPKGPRAYPHGSAQGHGLGGGRHGYPVLLVPPDELVSDLVPPQGAEVQVDVRGVGAELVHETLEEQPARERLRLREPQTVRNQGVGGAPTTRYRDPLTARYLRRLPRDEEVGREP